MSSMRSPMIWSTSAARSITVSIRPARISWPVVPHPAGRLARCTNMANAPGLLIAHGDELAVLQNESHAREVRFVGVHVAEQASRHVAGAVLGVEEFGRFDVQHLLAGRDRQ